MCPSHARAARLGQNWPYKSGTPRPPMMRRVVGAGCITRYVAMVLLQAAAAAALLRVEFVIDTPNATISLEGLNNRTGALLPAAVALTSQVVTTLGTPTCGEGTYDNGTGCAPCVCRGPSDGRPAPPGPVYFTLVII